ncbi:carbohydrate ABC transporter permease [Paenarthrobacter sp. NPDC092416]|uniref:carbohydrate ABC transporter permease n=1 Tax=Paenarthrobacter sp. NPDC092416 TaxID=3364386 RepID=UPI00381210DF
MMILPAVGGLALFQLFPFGRAFADSLMRFNPFTQAPNGFAGLSNYAEIANDPSFWTSVANTAIYGIGILGLELPLALGLALLLNQAVAGTALARTAVIASLAASEAVISLLWFMIYDKENGLFNGALGLIGLGPMDLLTDGSQAKAVLILMAVWKDIGLPTLIFLAGLQSIPQEYYEAASLDGAGKWSVFRHITLPGLRKSILLATFMVTVAATRFFTPIILMTQGGPNHETSNLMYYSYEEGFLLNSYGTGSAAVIAMVALLAVVTAIQIYALRERD